MLRGWVGEGWHHCLTEATGTVVEAWIPREYTSCPSIWRPSLCTHGSLAAWLLNANVVKECPKYVRMILLHKKINP